MQDDATEVLAPRRWWITAALLAIVVVVIVVAVTVARSSNSDIDRDPIAAPPGAPAADAYVVVTDNDIDTDELRDIAFDLGEAHLVRQESIRYIGRATSALGTTHLVDWLQDRTREDGSQLLETCQGQLSNYGSSGSGGAGCSSASDPVEGPLVSRGGTVGDDESFARVSLFETPPGARWMQVTTARDEIIVANVINAASYIEWVSSTRGDIKSIALLDSSLAEIWADDNF